MAIVFPPFFNLIISNPLKTRKWNAFFLFLFPTMRFPQEGKQFVRNYISLLSLKLCHVAN